jgi:hypothetical protein
VSVEDNFFSLGGHLLLATQIVYRTRETFHVDLPLRSLFESPTIANAARLIEKLQKESSSDSSSGPAIVRRERRRTGVAANEK